VIKKTLGRGLLYTMLPPALIYNLVTPLIGRVWDGYWETVHFIRSGGRG
jgi:hypothetical protein